MRQVRTIKECVEVIRKEDPGTTINEWAIRRAIRDGSLAYKRNGKWFYVAVEDVKSRFGMM